MAMSWKEEPGRQVRHRPEWACRRLLPLCLYVSLSVLLPRSASATASWTSSRYRWRNDDGSESSATWKAAADTAITGVTRRTNIRIRFALSCGGESGQTAACSPRLQYAADVAGPWSAVPTSGALAPFVMSATAHYADGAPTTAQLSGVGSWIANGKCIEAPSDGMEVPATDAGKYNNVEFCFQATAKARGATTYHIRCLGTAGGEAELTIEPGELNETPEIISPLTASTPLGSPFSYTLLANGPEPITFGVSGLPSGLTFDGTNMISGYPEMDGTFDVTLSAVNTAGSDTETLVLTVEPDPSNQAPTANAGSDQDITATAPTMQVTLDGTGSSDPDGDTLHYEWVLPDTTVLTGATEIVYLPVGTSTVHLTVRDYRGGVDSDQVVITVQAPRISVDDIVVLIPEGSAGTGTVTVANTGDLTLNWSVSETVQLDDSAIIREFPVTWKSSYSSYATPYTMTYDATRDVLWVGYYYDTEVGKIRASDGAILGTTDLGTAQPYALDMEGPDLWLADYAYKNFKRFNPNTWSNTQTIAAPGTWSYGPGGMARDGGTFYATQHNSYDIDKLDWNTGAILKTLAVGERFSYTISHIDYHDGALWHSRYTAPRNAIDQRDPASGDLLRSLGVASWSENSTIFDISFVNSTQCWMLTRNVYSANAHRAHLIDLSGAESFEKSAAGGTVTPGNSADFTVSLGSSGLSRGWHPVTLTFRSDDPVEPVKEMTVLFVVHEDAPNTDPVADAGPDRHERIDGATAPFILDPDGLESSDPDGDPLTASWSWTDSGEPVDVGPGGLVELGPGTYAFTLTVDDLRGGTDSDEMVFTVERVPPRDWEGWHGTMGTGHACETNENWLQNWPPTIAWINRGLVGSCSSPIVSEGRVYYCAQSRIHCLDAYTGETLWFGADHWGKTGDSTPAVDDKYVYVGTWGGEPDGSNASRGGVYCYDKVTGERIWYKTDIGPSYGWDWEDEYGSLTALGDLVFYGQRAMNRHTGDTLWLGSRTVHWKPFDWEGHTRMLCGSNGKLYDTVTGEEVLYAGPRVRNGESWYPNTQTHGSDRVWTIDQIYQIGGPKISDFGDVGVVTYTQPVTMGDDGYFVKGGHGCGGQVYHVDLNDGTKTAVGVGVGTMIAVRDKGIGYKSGNVYLIENTPSGPGYRTYGFDSGSRDYAECAYVDQRIFLGGADGFTCLYTGLAAPVLEQRDSVWDARTARATFRGWLENTGGRPTQGYLYWGPSNGGTNAANWEHCTPVGEIARGSIDAVISNAPADAVIFYRWFAENDRGGTWAKGSVETLSTYQPVPVEGDKGLLVHWTFDEGSGKVANDASGNAHEGTLDNEFNGSEWTNGVLGGGLYFPPKKRGVRLNGELSHPINEAWTLAAWARLEVGGGNTFVRISEWRGGPSRLGQTVRFHFVRPKFQIIDRGGKHTCSKLVEDDQWHHYACVHENGRSTMYVDGRKEMTWSVPDQVYRACFVGEAEWDDGCSYVFVDDMRTYRRALNGAEIQALAGMAGGTESDAFSAVAAGSDDAEEASNGTVTLDGPELNLGTDDGGDQRTVGLRFAGLNIPRYATITAAHIQFASSSAQSAETVLELRAHDVDDAPTFTSAPGGISARPKTDAAVPWLPESWGSGSAGADQRSPNLAGVVQEVVDRPGWASGNAVALLITGRGRRVVDAFENASGMKPTLAVQWTDERDMDGDLVQDAYERAAGAPSGVTPGDDTDGDTAINCHEYIAGTDLTDSNSVLRLRLRGTADGRVVVGWDGMGTDGPGYDGLERYYALECRETLIGIGTGAMETVWLEDFALTNGTQTDTGETAWVTLPDGTFQVEDGYFKAAGGDWPGGVWESEPIPIMGRSTDISLDIRGTGSMDSGDYIKVYYSMDYGSEKLIAQRFGKFNGTAWETVRIQGLQGMAVRIIIRTRGRHGDDTHYWDNVKVECANGADWPGVQGFSDIPADTDRTIEYTNNTPAKTEFYRVKARLR